MSEFHNTVYYENCTDIGGWESHEVINGAWETFDQAKHDMQNYANALSAKAQVGLIVSPSRLTVEKLLLTAKLFTEISANRERSGIMTSNDKITENERQLDKQDSGTLHLSEEGFCAKPANIRIKPIATVHKKGTTL